MEKRLSTVDQLDPDSIKARRILVVGPTDGGKTTLIKRLYNHWCTREKVLVLDSDVGQSDVGPPGSLGLGTGSAPVEDLAQLREIALHFAGVLSPPEDLAQFTWGVERLFRLALSMKPDRLLVDTTGWIWGEAISLKMAKCNLINPDLIVAIIREETPLIRVLKHSTFPLLVLEPSPKAKTRDTETRRRFRLQRVKDHFYQGRKITLDLQSTLIMGRLQDLEDLKDRVVGLLDGAFRTLGTAWIKRVTPGKPSAEAWVRRVSRGEVRYIRVGPLMETDDTRRERTVE
ncbi:MAG: hypothetical protein DRI93_05570 [Aquificota bacterium]|nr:MAG: hypothetical protein DRI93_05570 [Aquificota bacterium]